MFALKGLINRIFTPSPVIPNILYKYRSFENGGRDLSILEDNYIWFSSPQFFNDTFDCSLRLSPNQISKIPTKNVVDIMTEFMYLEEGGDKTLIKERVIYALKNNITRDWVRSGPGPFSQHERLLKDLKVFSLARSAANMLMWSHYSYYHQGFSIGFNSKKLLESVIKHCSGFWHPNPGTAVTPLQELNCKVEIQQVKYLSSPPTIKPTVQTYVYGDRRQFLAKPFDWKYEDEYRMIIRHPDSKVAFDASCIEEVILGGRASSNISKVVDVLKAKRYSHVKIFIADSVYSNYSVQLRPLKSS